MMPSIRTVFILTLGTALFLPLAPGSILAQAPEAGRQPAKFKDLEALNAAYHEQLNGVERRWINDLATLAGKATGPEREATYRQLFNLAIARNLCSAAMPAAEQYLALAPSSGQDVCALATLVKILARAEKGDHDQSLADLGALFKKAASGPQPVALPDTDTALAVGESYLQRLIGSGRYDIARKLCAIACQNDAPAAVQTHFEARMARLDLVGKAAPPIAGVDVDDRPVSLADYKGKVVLIDFWATWCPPCVASIPALNRLAQKYHDQGLVILGINVDAMHEDVKDIKTALPVVRRFLIKHGVSWTNLLNGQGAGDFATAYGVEEIPAGFLLDRGGKIIAVDQSGEELERAIVGALGELTTNPSK
jgi:thiol-disulfide isomerase/thioredoxin